VRWTLALLATLAACADDRGPQDILEDAAVVSVDAAPEPGRCRPSLCAWHLVPSGTTASLLAFVRASGELRASTSDGRWLAPTPDGTAWAPDDRQRPAATSYAELDAIAVATVAGVTSVQRSDDSGLTFKEEFTGTSSPMAQVINAYGTLVAVGGPPLAVRWTEGVRRWNDFLDLPRFPTGSALYGLVACSALEDPFVTVAVGTSAGRALIIRSENFSAAWTIQPTAATATASTLRAVAWNGRVPGVIVAVGDGGAILWSADGITWAAADSGTTTDLVAVHAAGGIFVAAGRGGVVSVSADGKAWTAGTAGTADLAAVGSDGTRMLVGGAGGVLYASDPP